MAMTLRLTPELERVVAMLAEADGVSKQEAISRAIADSADRRLHRDRVAELSARGRDRYAELLARLAQ